MYFLVCLLHGNVFSWAMNNLCDGTLNVSLIVWMWLGWSKSVFPNVLEKVLATFWHMCQKETQLRERRSRRFTRFQANMHARREVSHEPFLKLKQFWKICPANTLINCITQSFLILNTVSKVSESFHFLKISENISCSA